MTDISINFKDNIAYINGATKHNWASVVEEGRRLCADGTASNVVILDDRKLPTISTYQDMGKVDEADIVIIGGGISGCAIARELSRYNCSVLLIEKCSDISEGTTKANNGMIHSGYDSPHGTLKAKLNVQGNAMYTQWAKDLGFEFNRTGSFVCGFTPEDKIQLEKYLENGLKNNVPDIAIISGDDARKIEPALSDKITWALWTPSAAYVEPYEVAVKLMEDAMDNGARLRLDCQVMGFCFSGDGGAVSQVVTNQGIINCKHVINAAGLYADDIAWYAGDRFYSIHARRGVLAIFDKQNTARPKTFSGIAPSNYTKGGGPMMTPAGTMLWGPSAEEVWDKEDVSVDTEGLGFVLDKGYRLLRDVQEPGVITYFAGNRAASFNEDFIICNSQKLCNFTHVAGIQSPGLAASPAIAKMVVNLVKERLTLVSTQDTIVCRCELVSEGDIIRAIHGRVPARTLDAVKRRTRAGMGRCQSGFCGAKILEILARELNIDPTLVTLKGEGSQILFRENR